MAAAVRVQRADAALGLLRCPHQLDQVAEGVNHIVRLAMLEFCQATKAIGDGTGLEASRFSCQDVCCVSPTISACWGAQRSG